MKLLMNGCAAAVLTLGLAGMAHAEIVVRDAPVHAVPADDDGDAAAIPAPAKDAVPPPEPAAVQALVHPKSPTAPVLTPDEAAFFDALGHRLTDAASAYESYVRRAGAIDPAFTSAAQVRKALTAGEAYQPVQLEEGAVAYAALIALRNPAFVDGVRGVRDGRFFESLADDPQAVMNLPGATEAAADAAGVLRAHGETLIQSGKAITKAAYDIQAQPWSKGADGDPKGILQAAKTSADQTRAATVPSKGKLLASLASAPQTPSPAGAGTPDVVRGLALAALAISGRTGDGQEQAFERLLRDPAGVECLKTAKLNLNQCLAVAGPHYEDVYCVGRHGVSDTGKCVVAAAGADGPAPPLAPQPQQQAAGYGREEAEAYGRALPLDPEPDDVAQPAPAGADAQNDDVSQPSATRPPYPQPYPQPRRRGTYPQPAYADQGYPSPRGYAGQSGYPSYAYGAPDDDGR